jgi:hypothetical protein
MFLRIATASVFFTLRLHIIFWVLLTFNTFWTAV